ncbi:MAG: glycosyltransferase family 39 protein [Patescibacteria group bacterium]
MNLVFKKNNLYKVFLFSFFIFLVLFRLHNASEFNPYWGYDGGGHLEYIQKIYEENKLPSMEENYLAWHEPGFYYFYAQSGHVLDYFAGDKEYDFYEFIVKMWQIFSAMSSVLMIYLVYKIAQQFTSNKNVWLAAVFSSGFLSVITETTNYLTNELLLAFLVILLFYYFIRFSKKGWNLKRVIYISILSGIALLTKLSALIFIFSIIIWFIYRSIYTRKFKWLGYVILLIFVSVLIYSPWAIYKQKNIGSLFSINIYEDNLSESRELNSDFFYRLNPQVFTNPFWMTSSNSFWAVIFADTFSDYYSISNNLDKSISLPDNQRLWVDSGNFVTHMKYRLSVVLLYFSIFFILIFFAGVIGLIWQLIKKKLKPSINLFVLIYIIGSFLALMYNVFSFPFLERGTLKASFVLSVWPILMLIGWSWLANILDKFKLNFLWIPVWFLILIWGGLSIAINWI